MRNKKGCTKVESTYVDGITSSVPQSYLQSYLKLYTVAGDPNKINK